MEAEKIGGGGIEGWEMGVEGGGREEKGGRLGGGGEEKVEGWGEKEK